MQIPPKLNRLLSEDSQLMGSVQQSLTQFQSWIADGTLPFFPEYTNHGIKHISSVFSTAEGLISDEAWDVMSPSDAATIILAILVHDSAMHLTPDSFIALIDERNIEYRLQDFDSKTWCQLWNEFIADAKRFDGRTLMGIFGNNESVREPPLDPDNMTGRDRKLIGEFLRRHHHRLAHEIALFGVPGPGSNRIKFDINLDEDIADLSGLVARSHGVMIRSCLSYLESKYTLREYKQIHAVFLMTLIRIADYLQIESQRAPKELLKVNTLRSPVSKGEWDFHHAIETIEYHDDPESLLVIAKPKEVKTFLKIKDLLRDFQTELDISWAVLGEVYGPFKDRNLHKLGLKIRRVRSNLDDVSKFAKQVSYIPRRAAFTTAGPQVLNLLVEPLYNNDLAFGIRELIQNGVDAVHELKEYQSQKPSHKPLNLRKQKANVIVSLQTEDTSNTLWLTISDQGIGMTPHVICNYFLRAGASFRESDAWRKEFMDEEGKSLVARSGRFGVGILAGFLIGSQMHVTTRSINTSEDQGTTFIASLDMDTIELKRTSCPIGTEIRIKVKESLARDLSIEKWRSAMDWYYLSEPSIRLEIDGKKFPPKHSLHGPMLKDLPCGWRRTLHPHYQDIHWSYKDNPALSCNGIRIIRSTSNLNFDIPDKSKIDGRIRIPNISVYDYDGKLPLNLQRTRLTETLPFADNILNDIIRDFLAFTLVYAPNESMANSSTWDFYQYIKYPGLDIPIRQIAPWFCTIDGISLLDNWQVMQVNPKSAIVFFLNSQNELLQYVPSNTVSAIGLQWPPIQRYFDNPASPIATLSSLMVNDPDPELKRIPNISGIRILLPTMFLSSLDEIVTPRVQTKQKNKRIQYTETLRNYAEHVGSQLCTNPKCELEEDDWRVFSVGRCPAPSPHFEKLLQNLPTKVLSPDASILAEWYFDESQIETDMSIISEVWKEIIGEPVIPYDPIIRRKKLAHAFKILESYTKAHEIEKGNTQRTRL